MELDKEDFLKKTQTSEDDIIKNEIDFSVLNQIYIDYDSYRSSYESQAGFIADTLRTHKKIHSVKSRVKEPDRLIEKIIRKTTGRKEKYGPEFKFSMENYKEEINDLIGVRAIHIFKEDWEDIHN
ncbi:RelA/SpoT domain-containing protein, partial [Clostridium sp.]|uniref:RelA/SpoT domain-containing protein n=1 Tax=Clostridium sp. TaxID=1506 RepID=UPI003EEBF2C1